MKGNPVTTNHVIGTTTACGAVAHFDFATEKHLTITGPAGSGKTSVAHLLAVQMAEAGNDVSVMSCEPGAYASIEGLAHLVSDRFSARTLLASAAKDLAARMKMAQESNCDWGMFEEQSHIPRRLLIIDSFEQFTASFDDQFYEDDSEQDAEEEAGAFIGQAVRRILQHGAAVGIHLLVCANEICRDESFLHSAASQLQLRIATDEPSREDGCLLTSLDKQVDVLVSLPRR